MLTHVKALQKDNSEKAVQFLVKRTFSQQNEICKA